MKSNKSTARGLMLAMCVVSVLISIAAIILMFTMHDQSMLARKIMFSGVIVLLEACYIIKFNVIGSKNPKLYTAIMTVFMIALAVCLWVL